MKKYNRVVIVRDYILNGLLEEEEETPIIKFIPYSELNISDDFILISNLYCIKRRGIKKDYTVISSKDIALKYL